MSEATDSVTFKIKSPQGKVKEYVMKYSMWLDDQSDQTRLVNVHKQIDIKELWIARMEKATIMKRDEITKLPNWEMSALILKWFEMNDVSKETFLGKAPSSLDEPLSSTPS